ncbi:MAG: hypothetical protein PVI30_12460 [Myxococcales bacterium]
MDAATLQQLGVTLSGFENVVVTAGSDAHKAECFCAGEVCGDGLDNDCDGVPENGCAAACTDYTDTLIGHELAGRATSQTRSCGWFCTETTWYAVGSNADLGTWGFSVVTLREPSPGYYEPGSCP